jgi:ABC-type amino acid transport substrate-binding protein
MACLSRLTALLLLVLLSAPALANPPGAKTLVRVGIFPFEPINFLDTQGNAQGLNPDLLNRIASLEGWRAASPMTSTIS